MLAIERPDQITPEVAESIAAVGADWAGDGRIEWEDMLARIERMLDLDLPATMDHPVIRKVQRIVRAAVAEARA